MAIEMEELVPQMKVIIFITVAHMTLSLSLAHRIAKHVLLVLFVPRVILLKQWEVTMSVIAQMANLKLEKFAWTALKIAKHAISVWKIASRVIQGRI